LLAFFSLFCDLGTFFNSHHLGDREDLASVYDAQKLGLVEET